MKSFDETSWSDQDVEDVLTAFFKAEVPAQLQTERPALVQRPAAPTTRPRWNRAATVASCVAVLLLAVVVSGSIDWPWSQTDQVVAEPDSQPGTSDEDERFNVNAIGDDSDMLAPELDIELYEDPPTRDNSESDESTMKKPQDGSKP